MPRVKKINSGTFFTFFIERTPCQMPESVVFTLLYMESRFSNQ